ncbi:VWA domain-containing protein [Ethanoligenens harbinense]|uniref:von Willebrand factor type A n=1 Tax=Ethanoligenens harbinense (strain DSM 18485 / JCM 12961 / CGMCC 1.5033 / YUAN-3) TaxID=663278 RepID=E6U4H5_ETHHY|nr:VWA domain-containing protein [Ethanoligenens harbinense]ADU27782.1 von Willebrand factor type A [Ethanoligenens harbinense YUAN-3]
MNIMRLFRKHKSKISFTMAVLLAVGFSGCGSASQNAAVSLTVLSASENKEIAPIITQFTKQTGIKVNMVYKGSVDIMQTLQQGNIPYDAVWPANSMWINLGDKAHKVKLQQSIMTSPVVFGVEKDLAEQLGYVGHDVTVDTILQDVKAGKLKFCMTSATQSNSGASAYIGFWYALRGNPDVLTEADLNDQTAQNQMKELLSGVNRSSGSSEWLKDLYLQGGYSAMVNYEDVIIETNKELVKQKKQPLYVVYPKDGLTIADSPLGYIDNANSAKESAFKKFQSYLLSDKVQKALQSYGRRTGTGSTVTVNEPATFNPAWGIDTSRTLNTFRMPDAGVLVDALNLYQTSLRKPSYTVYCLDYSGSMGDNGGETGVKKAMDMILNQSTAKLYFLQATPQDKIAVIAFSDSVKAEWYATGGDLSSMSTLDQNIQKLQAGGGTDIYTPVMTALQQLAGADVSQCNPAVILMTDGQSNTGRTFTNVQSTYKSIGKDIPIFSIEFGAADPTQLKQFGTLSKAALFDGRKDLVAAFKQAKSYN